MMPTTCVRLSLRKSGGSARNSQKSKTSIPTFFILAKYTVINYISTKRVIPIDIDSLPDQCANIASPHEEIVAKDTQLLIDMIVENMPPQRQTIYRMSREQHLKNEEIAQQLGLQKKTVENHLNLALKEIKKALYLMILLQLHWV